MRGARRFRSSRLLALAAAAMLLAAACEPLVNAPPGGGERIKQTFRIGPFVLGPGQEAMGSPTSGMPRPPGAFGLKNARFDVVDAAGNPVHVHDVHLHHIVMTTSAAEDALCRGRRERFIGAGMERTPIDLWGPYAYLVGAGDQWGAIYHLMNETPAGTPAKTVYIQYTLWYEPGATAENSRPVRPYFQDVTGCGDSTYDIPGTGGPGSVHTKARSWTAPADGLVVATGGHLHEGGIDITLENDTTDTTICTSVATYHEDPRHLSRMSRCLLHEKVEEGDQFTVRSRYDNHEPIADVMGIMLTYVWWGTQ